MGGCVVQSVDLEAEESRLSATAAAGATPRFRPLRVERVVAETADAVSLVLDVPGEGEAFRYRAGQFVTFRVVIDGVAHQRSYSMSSSPSVDADLQVTVKRVPGGLVSNWLLDSIGAGDVVDVSPPTGSFVLDETAPEIVAFAAGSGITPIFSILKAALAGPRPRVRLLYANRDRASVIFAAELEELAARHAQRFTALFHLDDESGFVDRAEIAELTGGPRDAVFYVCGPTEFMATVQRSLVDLGIGDSRIHIERFTPWDAPAEAEAAAPAPAAEGEATPVEVTIRLGGRTVTVAHRPGTTILQTVRFAGLRPPSSCETGTCATCMAQVVEGHAVMRNNEALTPEEVAAGWVLTCQAEPASPTVHVVYE